MDRGKWKGEGVAQTVYEEACVSHVSSINVACSSDAVADNLYQLLQVLKDPVPEQNAAAEGTRCVTVCGTNIRMTPAQGWIRKAREFMKGKDYARISTVEWEATSDECIAEMESRGVSIKEGVDKGKFSIAGLVETGLSQSMWLASSTSVGVLPTSFTVAAKDGPEGIPEQSR